MFAKVYNEEEREKLVELISKVATIDGDYSEDEKRVIDDYKQEYGMQVIPDTGDIKSLTEYFAGKNAMMKKMTMFEIYSMLSADRSVTESEKNLVEEIRAAFDISEAKLEQIIEAVQDLQKAQDKVFGIML